MPMPRTADVVIVGGGIIGSAIAYFIKQLAGDASVLVIERDPTYRKSCTRLSASAIRQQFNLAINVAMSQFTYNFFRNATAFLGVNGEAVDLRFVDCPYLVLAAPDGVERLASAHERQLAAGARVQFLKTDQLARKVPWIKPEGIGAACLGLEGEGWFDSMLALRALRRKAEALGVIYVAAEVVAIHRSGTTAGEVVTADGNTAQSQSVINAAGAQAAKVAAMAGVPLPIESRKRCAFVFKVAQPVHGFTNLVDPTFKGRGVYARPYGELFMSMTSPDPAEDPDTDNLDVDYSLFGQIIKPALARRVRGFESIELVEAWAGLYEMNCFDQNAVLGPHPEFPNFFLACGLSGHGVMHSGAIGRGLAELVITGRYQTLDLSPFSYDRIPLRRPLDDVQASEHREVRAGV